MKKLFKTLLLTIVGIAASAITAEACTNFIVTKGASTDGSNMVTYAADSHSLYGALYSHIPGKFTEYIDVNEWDSGRYLGKIKQVPTTYRTLGNSNEHSLFITETTFGGREELKDPNGGIDYGSLIYIALQRAKTAREAIQIIVDLANTYGYASSGESFSIIDNDEAWIMELIGKGPNNKGIVWVALRIPDGYVSAHANQARIMQFPLNDKENSLYAPDVISFAREQGYFNSKDEEFSFSDTYAPLDFGGMRACEARVWAFFRTIADDMDKYEDYAMGYNAKNRMPLWVKPRTKLSPKLIMDCMRDHYEGTKMDMTTDIGAGGEGCPYRWRPMHFEVDGVEYLNERAIATQQTGFWLLGQARPGKKGILWFGTDDAATAPLTKQMEEAVDNRDEETAASLCEKILRNYPNSVRAVDACADCCYRLFIYTQKNTYMEQCIAQTKRLMILNQGELERKRLERIHDLGNQYELLSQWDTAKDYYEQSNVGGSDDAAIAGCLLNQGKTQEAIKKLSDMLVESIFQQFHAVNRLADGWSTVGENEKACAALEWMYGAMESLRYNPTTMILIQAKLAGLYHDCGKKEMMEAALRKASVLAAETDTQEVGATADFLQIEEARKMLINATGNKDLLMGIATSAGSSFAEVVNEVLQ